MKEKARAMPDHAEERIVLVPGGRESFDRCTTATPVGGRELDVENVSRAVQRLRRKRRLPILMARMTESKRSEFRPQVEKEGCGQKIGQLRPIFSGTSPRGARGLRENPV
ncbi:hypothetical protein TNCV_1989951 [Trichonephila clavipes]|nr:hypothetical protein TNCV_1989951 [Trichonephila clavipes]